jgi:hypothetical protein
LGYCLNKGGMDPEELLKYALEIKVISLFIIPKDKKKGNYLLDEIVENSIRSGCLRNHLSGNKSNGEYCQLL